MKIYTLAITAALCGCSSSPTDQVVSVENNSLGITQIEIERTTANGDKLLTIHGVSSDGQEVAGATLRTGSIMFNGDESAPPSAMPGRELIVWVGSDTTAPVGIHDLVPFELHSPWGGSFDQLLALKPVASALAEQNLFFRLPQSPGEADYGNPVQCASGDTSKFPAAKGTVHECCTQAGDYYFRADASPNPLGTSQSGAVCSQDGVTSNCTGGMGACNYGPCGTYPVNGGGTGSNAHVFYPTTNTAVCGRDDNLDPPVPTGEHYANQQLYTDITPSCTWAYCLSGYPVYGSDVLTFSFSNGGNTGAYVTTSLGSATLTGTMYAGTYSGGYSGQQVTLSALGLGGYTAHWSGACTKIGGVGQATACTITVSSSLSESLTYLPHLIGK